LGINHSDAEALVTRRNYNETKQLRDGDGTPHAAISRGLFAICYTPAATRRR